MKPTNIFEPSYFHKVVDCQWACPAHTPVPEYIRLIAQEKYTEAYMLNWDSNVFPGILGRTCDRPCEPACRRVRTEEKPVAICRLKRVAADNKGDITAYMPRVPKKKNGKRIALLGAGPGFARGRARSAAARLRSAHVRKGPGRRRHDAHADPGVPPPNGSVGGRGRSDSEHGRRASLRPRRHQHEGDPRRRLRCLLRRHRCAARPRSAGSEGAQGIERAYFDRYRMARQRCVRPHDLDQRQSDRHGRRQHGDGLLPHRASSRCRSGDRGGPFRLRRHESVGVGKRRRDVGRHSDRQQPPAGRVRARERQAERRDLPARQADHRRVRQTEDGADRRARRSSWKPITC